MTFVESASELNNSRELSRMWGLFRCCKEVGTAHWLIVLFLLRKWAEWCTFLYTFSKKSAITMEKGLAIFLELLCCLEYSLSDPRLVLCLEYYSSIMSKEYPLGYSILKRKNILLNYSINFMKVKSNNVVHWIFFKSLYICV